MTSKGLGAGSYGFAITEWAGRMVWRSTDTNFQSVQYARELSAMSKASLEARMPYSVANQLEPWVHILTVYRDDAVVWHGVITRVEMSGGLVKVEASDGAVMFSRRRIPISRWWAQHDATQVMSTMVGDACGFRDPVGMVDGMVTYESRIWVTASYTAGESMLSAVIDKLEQQGLVWTINAGRLLVGPLPATHTTAQLTDQDMDGGMSVIKDGADCVTDVLVTGSGVWGQYGLPDTPVGLLQAISKSDGAVREEECVQQAKRLVEEGKVPPRRVVMNGSSRLLPSAPISINELVPGVRVPVSSLQAGVRLGAVMQLTKVAVKVDSGGEKVSVTLGEVLAADTPTNLPDPAELDWRSPYEKELAKKNPSATPKDKNQPEKIGTPPA